MYALPDAHLDLGCGANPRNPYGRRNLHGIDIRPMNPAPGIAFAVADLTLEPIPFPENAFGSADSRASRWLTALTIDPHAFGADVAQVRAALERINVESRPVWKPLHQRPAFASCRAIGGHVANALSLRGICLPSGSSLSLAHQERVIAAIRAGSMGRPYSGPGTALTAVTSSSPAIHPDAG